MKMCFGSPNTSERRRIEDRESDKNQKAAFPDSPNHPKWAPRYPVASIEISFGCGICVYHGYLDSAVSIAFDDRRCVLYRDCDNIKLAECFDWNVLELYHDEETVYLVMTDDNTWHIRMVKDEVSKELPGRLDELVSR